MANVTPTRNCPTQTKFHQVVLGLVLGLRGFALGLPGFALGLRVFFYTNMLVSACAGGVE